jgi:DNA-binding FrmR family transcriptional regulator
MDHDTQHDILRRLAYIEGHLAGVRRMIEQDQYCVDVLKLRPTRPLAPCASASRG